MKNIYIHRESIRKNLKYNRIEYVKKRNKFDFVFVIIYKELNQYEKKRY